MTISDSDYNNAGTILIAAVSHTANASHPSTPGARARQLDVVRIY